MPACCGQRAAEPEPDRGVVVAADENHVDPGARERRKRLVEQGDRVGRRHRAVVHVTGDEHGIDTPRHRSLDQPGKERALVRQHRLAVQRAAEMPVGGVQQFHRFGV